MTSRVPAFAFALLLLPAMPAVAQTTCADAYAVCMSPCGDAKFQAPERCMQGCRAKRDSCMTTGTLRTGYQNFRGLQRVLEESPAISAWDLSGEPPPSKKDAQSSAQKRTPR